MTIRVKQFQTMGAYTFIFILTVLLGCSKGNNENRDCDKQIIVSKSSYDEAPNDPLTINSATLEGDCLTISFSAGGCDGNSWKVELIDSGDIAESLPVQRFIRLSLDDQEACKALITQEVQYDISNIKLSGEGEININLLNDNSIINYKY